MKARHTGALHMLQRVVDKQGFRGIELAVVNHKPENPGIGFDHFQSAGKIGFFKDRGKVVIPCLFTEHLQVIPVMDFVGIAQQKEPVMLFHLFEALYAGFRDIDQKCIPGIIDLLIGDRLIKQLSHAFPERTIGNGTAFQIFDQFLGFPGCRGITDPETKFKAFFFSDFRIKITNHPSKIENDVLDGRGKREQVGTQFHGKTINGPRRGGTTPTGSDSICKNHKNLLILHTFFRFSQQKFCRLNGPIAQTVRAADS